MVNFTLPSDTFSKSLIKWFYLRGRHNLPWQINATPYRVWVSEIMLQQTQVKTVIPFYEKFMRRFSDVKTLSDNNLDDVLTLWSGLGYYSRARRLHKASKIIMEKHEGILPHTVEKLMALPGIGRSTAGAIVALSLNKRAPMLDGNAKRVFCRYHAIKTQPDNAQKKKRLWAIAENHLPTSQFRDYTQALMDLGATVCKTIPLCSECPLNVSCAAHLSNSSRLFPGSNPKRTQKKRSSIFIILENKNGDVLLEKRPATGIWGGLWSFPEATDYSAAKNIVLRLSGADNFDCNELPSLTHQFTHFKLSIKPLHFAIKDHTRISKKNDRIWADSETLDNLGLPKPVRDLLETVAVRQKERRSG